MTARSRFYASMSHELRTPINAVLGYSTLLLESIYGPLNEKQAEGIERTQKAARHLLELVNDVLDLSKIEAGKIDLRLQPVEFPALIEDLFVTVRPLADEHGIGARRSSTTGEPIKVVIRSAPRAADPAQSALERDQVREGQADPRRRARRATDGGVVIEVSDQGEGIAPRIRRRSSTSSCSSERRSSGGNGARPADLAAARRDAARRSRRGIGGREGEHVPALRLPDSADGPAIARDEAGEVASDVGHAPCGDRDA